MKEHLAPAADELASNNEEHLIHHDHENVTSSILCTGQETILVTAGRFCAVDSIRDQLIIRGIQPQDPAFSYGDQQQNENENDQGSSH